MTIISETIYNATSKYALVPFITAGDPNIQATVEAIIALDHAGADVLELGIPYSVPLADGPTIQEASHRALLRNTNLDSIFDLVKNIKNVVNIPNCFVYIL